MTIEKQFYLNTKNGPLYKYTSEKVTALGMVFDSVSVFSESEDMDHIQDMLEQQAIERAITYKQTA